MDTERSRGMDTERRRSVQNLKFKKNKLSIRYDNFNIKIFNLENDKFGNLESSNTLISKRQKRYSTKSYHGYLYILKCSDGTYYTGSTRNMTLRLRKHQMGEGSNYTKKRLPVKLVYCEEFQNISNAFIKEKQIQGWGRKKKESLINKNFENLPELSECKNNSHFKNKLK